ncbi:SET domain-containing protein [Vibrio hepatarius]|uniref:SET domain-containing protein n=1 Tax=Vibrio hepatarius TaxID=171383 RepID=UPI00148D8CA7|nr:SET domain-containing methyltransferase [Vibrio hepatarius]NOI15849.1 SET domain-containing protein [Vibrio hepatarius]
MTKISIRLRKQAKAIRKTDSSKKLTQIQNELAVDNGYPSYKALLLQEKQDEISKRVEFATSSDLNDSHIYPTIGEGLEVYVRKDGLRGIRALSAFDIGDVVIDDKILINLGAYAARDPNREGMPWSLTRHLIERHSDLIDYMENVLKLRDSFKPKLNALDKEIIKEIVCEHDVSEAYVIKVYYLVTTYNLKSVARTIIPSLGFIHDQEFCLISLALCYANHSCNPNTVREGTATEAGEISATFLVATRKINIGDEITWSYFGECQHRTLKDRQKSLKREFGFLCNCSRCFSEHRKIKSMVCGSH